MKTNKTRNLGQKIRPSTDHRAKFHAGRPMHLGDLARGKIFFKN